MSAISVKGLTKKFKTFTAVSDLSFDVAENHVVGFLGPNGAGKTTTLRMLVGLSKPTNGTASIAGVPVTFGDAASNEKVGYLPEMPSFYAWMTGIEYMRFISDLFDIPKSVSEKKIAELLGLVDLTEARSRKISSYSGGMKQRLGIAQALVNDPEVLILDEPVSALDPFGRKEVLDVIQKLKKTKTILFSTHILSDVDRVCDDIVLIDKGKLISASPLSDLKAKYAAQILEIEFVSDPTKLLVKLKEQKWAKKVEKNGNLVRIWLIGNDVMTENTPLQFFAKENIGVLRYGLNLPETEDLFMQLIGGKE
jgi:ABC-2 type transport system ATP-binding protein